MVIRSKADPDICEDCGAPSEYGVNWVDLSTTPPTPRHKWNCYHCAKGQPKPKSKEKPKATVTTVPITLGGGYE